AIATTYVGGHPDAPLTVWTETGLWRRPHRAVLDELGARGEVDWRTSAVADAASVRAPRGDR
ncbi:hypothetical protein ACWELB_29020, partial [Streptomyces asiaticus]